MKFRYGNFEHASKDVMVNVSKQAERSPTGYWYATRNQITLTGSIFGDDQSTLINNINSLITAYAQDGQDFGLYFNDGTATPDIFIRNTDCIGGVKVTTPPHLDARNMAEYSTYWDYTIVLEALVRKDGANADVIWDFEESFEVTGTGGPKTVWVELKNYPAQPQRARNYTLCSATQQGRITGLNKYLTHMIPPPRFPEYMVEDSFRATKAAPKRIQGGLTEFTVHYSYQFESNMPFPLVDPTM